MGARQKNVEMDQGQKFLLHGCESTGWKLLVT